MTEPTPPEGYKRAFHHACGSLYCFAKLGSGPMDILKSENIRLLDGTQPIPMSLMPRCERCTDRTARLTVEPDPEPDTEPYLAGG